MDQTGQKESDENAERQAVSPTMDPQLPGWRDPTSAPFRFLQTHPISIPKGCGKKPSSTDHV